MKNFKTGSNLVTNLHIIETKGNKNTIDNDLKNKLMKISGVKDELVADALIDLVKNSYWTRAELELLPEQYSIKEMTPDSGFSSAYFHFFLKNYGADMLKIIGVAIGVATTGVNAYAAGYRFNRPNDPDGFNYFTFVSFGLASGGVFFGVLDGLRGIYVTKKSASLTKKIESNKCFLKYLTGYLLGKYQRSDFIVTVSRQFSDDDIGSSYSLEEFV